MVRPYTSTHYSDHASPAGPSGTGKSITLVTIPNIPSMLSASRFEGARYVGGYTTQCGVHLG
ncbi:hypothetical protein BD309DRAFT_963858 [Dichomitus squalens]|uniref:Uncharacterized protein n=1 Tax=Dichomitus squalens TaxID=114155 RepID=A0A4Q9PSI4_9APHY|nr:hypothetical protein BD309DRAFT_963858 [Dichomitus squalens]TBU57397.1 hypothetical protein BD310DRAFT_929292 [Dichomitus squalens]